MAGSQGVTITIAGLDKVQRELGTAKDAVTNMRPAMDSIGRYLSRFFSSDVFASRGAVIGKPWKPLNPRYAAVKAKRYPGRPPLVRTGVMQRSFDHTAGATFARVNNTDPKFNFHQSDEPRRKMPERVMMRVDQTREREIARIIGSFLEQRIGRAA